MFHLSKPLNRLDLRPRNHWLLLPCDLPTPWLHTEQNKKAKYKKKWQMTKLRKTQRKRHKDIKQLAIIWCRSHTVKSLDLSSITRYLVSPNSCRNTKLSCCEITGKITNNNNAQKSQNGLHSYNETLCKLRAAHHIVKAWNRSVKVCK